MNDGRDSNDLDRAHDHNPPAFNLPRIVTISCAVLIAAHALRLLLDQDANAEIFLQFAFIPERYASMSEVHAWPGGLGAAVWSFVTYSFLHGDWMHLTLNVVWLAAFGAAVARRLKGLWFFILCALCSVAGAVTHLLVYGPDSGIVIVASAAV